MTTTTSSSKNTRFVSVYRAALRGQLPFAVVALILYVLLIPLLFFVGLDPHTGYGLTEYGEIVEFYRSRGSFQSGIYLADGNAGVVLAVIILLAFVLALVQNAYLHNKKMTDFYHSLPVNRTRLLSANFLSSMTTIFVPFLAVYLFSMAVQLIPYGQYVYSLPQYFAYTAIDLFSCILAAVVVYLFTTFVAVNVGTVFDAFAITGVIGILPTTLYLLGYSVWSSMTYGSQTDLPGILLLSPFSFAFQRFLNGENGPVAAEASGNFSGYLLSAGQMIIWLVIGIGLFLAAVACYKRRKSEIAEQTQPSGVLQIVVKVFGAFCGGMMFFAIFIGGGIIAWIPVILIGSVIIGLIGEVIFSRGFRSIRKNIKWLLLAGALGIVVVVGVRFDFTGYTTRVPAADEVESVKISYRGRFEMLSPDYYQLNGNYYGDSYDQQTTVLTEPESIAILTQAHSQAVADQPPKDYEIEASDTEVYERLSSSHPYAWLEVTYQLKNGKELQRYYRRMATEALQTLISLDDKTDFITSNHAAFRIETTDHMRLQMYNAYGQETANPVISPADGERLLDAVRQDLLGETLAEIHNPSAPARGYLLIRYDRPLRDSYMGYDYEYYDQSQGGCYVVVGESYTNTIQVLSDLGLLEHLQVSDKVDSISLSSVMGDSLPNNTFVLTPASGMIPGASVEYDWEDATTTSDNPAEIAAVLAAGRNQMLIQRRDLVNSDVVLVHYFSGSKPLGAQLVRWSELPEALRARMETYDSSQSDGEEEALVAETALSEDVSGIIPEATPLRETITLR